MIVLSAVRHYEISIRQSCMGGWYQRYVQLHPPESSRLPLPSITMAGRRWNYKYLWNEAADVWCKLLLEALKAVKTNLYVDDYLGSADTEENNVRITSGVLENGDFHLVCWTSNSTTLVSDQMNFVGESLAHGDSLSCAICIICVQ